MSAQIIAITNQKGGVGRTTTAVNLGMGLAHAGKLVLLVDAVPQGSLTISMGIKEVTLETLMQYKMEFLPLPMILKSSEMEKGLIYCHRTSNCQVWRLAYSTP